MGDVGEAGDVGDAKVLEDDDDDNVGDDEVGDDKVGDENKSFLVNLFFVNDSFKGGIVNEFFALNLVFSNLLFCEPIIKKRLTNSEQCDGSTMAIFYDNKRKKVKRRKRKKKKKNFFDLSKKIKFLILERIVLLLN